MINDKISKFRFEIDAIDDKILNLLNNRSKIVKQVGETKKPILTNGKSFIRSGREADIVRNVYKKLAKGVFPNQAASYIWRMIISASLSLESNLRIATLDDETYWLAREYFGGFMPFSKHKNATAIINAVIKGRAEVGVLPCKDKALLDLPADIRIFACVPFILEKKQQIKAYAFAKTEPEATGDDITVIKQKDKIIEKKGFITEIAKDARILGVYAAPLRVGQVK